MKVTCQSCECGMTTEDEGSLSHVGFLCESCREEEGIIEGLEVELKDKEKIIKNLNSRLLVAEEVIKMLLLQLEILGQSPLDSVVGSAEYMKSLAKVKKAKQ